MNNYYQVDENNGQINIFDERFYRIDGQDIFNVTGWLSAFPKGYGYELWLKNMKDPDAVRDEAAQKGSQVHALIETTLKGGEAVWEEHITKLEVWEKYLGWCRFWQELNDDPIKTLKLKLKDVQLIDDKTFTEFVIYNPEYPAYAGTIDKVISLKVGYEIKRYILDWKTGNSIHDTAYLQISAYAKAFERLYGKIDGAYIVQLDKLKYKVYRVEDIDAEFKIFRDTQNIYLRAFGEPKPKYKTYPIKVDMNFILNNKIKEL